MVGSKTLGRDQSFARAVNNDLVIRALRENDLSATDLAKKLNLSNAAMTSILRNLVNDGLIKVSHSISKVGKGRKQVIYTLNEGYGLIAVISFSSTGYSLTLSNIKEDILFEADKIANYYNEDLILDITLLLKGLVSQKRYNNIPLKNVTISYPGRVNVKSNELEQENIFDTSLCGKTHNLTNIIKEHLNCPVFVYNDINLAIIGQIRNGSLQNVKNGMLVYVDNGIGGALLLNGQLFGGEVGFAGEIGLFSTTFHGKDGLLDDFVSLRSIKEHFNLNNFQELLKEYKKTGDVYNYVNDTAISLGKCIKDVIELLNITTVVICGRVSEFKDKYYENVIKEANKALSPCNVIFDNTIHSSIITGAISMAYDKAIPSVDKDFIAA